MLALVRQGMSNPANYAAAIEKVDVDDLINYMLVNYYIGNDDWAHHNWYATYNRVEPDGQWRFHSWDAEHILKDINYNATLEGGYWASPEEVHLRLMDNEEYRVRFSDLVQKHLANGGQLTTQAVSATYQSRMDEVYRAIVGESARWGDSHTTSAEAPGEGGAYTREHWLATQNDLLQNYFPYRADIVTNQFRSRGWLLDTLAPSMNQYGGEVQEGFDLVLSNPNGSGAVYYTLDGSQPAPVWRAGSLATRSSTPAPLTMTATSPGASPRVGQRRVERRS